MKLSQVESTNQAIISMLKANAGPIERTIQCGHWTPSQWMAFNRLNSKYEPKRPPLEPPKPLKGQS